MTEHAEQSDSNYLRAGFGFDDAGRPVPIVQPIENPEGIVDILLDAGLDLPTADRLAPAIEGYAETLALQRAGEVIRDLMSRLDKTPAGRALERVLMGDGDLSLADDARQVGCTKQNLHYHVEAIRQKLPFDGDRLLVGEHDAPAERKK